MMPQPTRYENPVGCISGLRANPLDKKSLEDSVA